jgi:hypothetical protein
MTARPAVLNHASWVLAALVTLVVVRPARAQTPATPMRRIAVLVGANGAPAGRLPLRFAHDDAEQLADALVRVGRFAPADVHVLLDPAPAELDAILGTAARDVQAAAGDALFVFYYSGHSDGQSLYPHGEAVGVAGLRDRIEHIGARIRVGILDTCRGGSWTQAKGLTVGPPLDPTDLLNVSTEGTALVSSSSGLENAHEADAVNGSFFTHYFTAGLLGAADRTGDGNITLDEAFDYAKERTVRDSARLASVPQHPSFDLQLRGRQDIVLTSVASSPSALEVTKASAPLEVIHLPSGVTVAEVPPSSPGLPVIRIAVAPGHYLVRSVVDGRVLSHEFDVRAGETVSVSSGQLEATGDARIAFKGDEPSLRPSPVDEASTPPRGWGYWQVLLGETNTPVSSSSGISTGSVSHTGLSTRDFAADSSFQFGITDRLSWTFPAGFAYRLGTQGRFEVIPFAGLSSFGYANYLGAIFNLTAGVDARLWLARDQSLILGLHAEYDTFIRTSDVLQQTYLATAIANSAALTYAATIDRVVTLHFGVGVYTSEAVRSGVRPYLGPAVAFGGARTLAYRPLPLVEVHVSRRFSLDATAAWLYDVNSGDIGEEYLGGFTYAF